MIHYNIMRRWLVVLSMCGVLPPQNDQDPNAGLGDPNATPDANTTADPNTGGPQANAVPGNTGSDPNAGGTLADPNTGQSVADPNSGNAGESPGPGNTGDNGDPPPVLAAVGTATFTSGTCTLVVENNETALTNTVYDQVVNTFLAVYPVMCARFNADAGKTVTLTFDPNYDGVACAPSSAIIMSSKWIKDHPQDTDVVTHEAFHVMQSYLVSQPTWLVEGLADYGRYRYGLNNSAGGWSLPAYESTQNYTDSYRVTARFFVWCEGQFGTGLLPALDAALRANTYSASFWTVQTGKTIDQLWSDYAQADG